MSKLSTEELRAFYFSKATNYSNYQNRSSTPSDQKSSAASRPVPTPTTNVGTPLSTTVNTTVNTTQNETTTTQPARENPTVTADVSVTKKPVGSAIHAIKAADTTITKNKQNNQSLSVSGQFHGSADSVSPDYINFLRDQQDLVKHHNRIEQTLDNVLGALVQQREEHLRDIRDASELLQKVESSTDWNWKSKFTRETLAKDAELQVPFAELKRAEDIPNIVELQHQHQQLIKLRQSKCPTKDSHPTFNAILENGVRRFDRLIKEFSVSQMDSTPVVRLSDNVLMHLDNVLSLPSLTMVLQEVNDTSSLIARKQKESINARDQALEDGEMHIAERMAYQVADISDELTTTQVKKIGLLTQSAEENTVGSAIREAYEQKAREESKALEDRSADLKLRCETDLAKVYQLKCKVEDAEKTLSDRWSKDREESNRKIETIESQQQQIWEQMSQLVKQLHQLEGDRYVEYKKRVEEKAKDENRRNEYVVFSKVCDDYATNLDRTIRNCETNIHCTKLMSEFIYSAFFTIQKELNEKRVEIDDTLLEARKVHLEMYRSLLFNLGDLEYRKEKRMEEVDAMAKSAHAQQELCNESLNPNAKKFSDQKRELLSVRLDLEEEIKSIRDRIQTATDMFNPSSQGLTDSSVEHRHPLDELEDHRLETRARMVEYKSMALGTITAAPIRSEIDALRKSLAESRKLISRESTGKR